MQFGQQWTILQDQCEWHKHHIKLNNGKPCCFSHCLIVWYFWFCPCWSPLTASNFSFTSPLPDFPHTFILSHSPPLPSICFHLHPLKILSWPFPPHGSPLSSLSYSNLLAHFTPSTLYPPPPFFFPHPPLSFHPLTGALPPVSLWVLQLPFGPWQPSPLPQPAVWEWRERAGRPACHTQLRVHQLPRWGLLNVARWICMSMFHVRSFKYM